MDRVDIGEPIIEGRSAALTLIREGAPSAPPTEKQRAYEAARTVVFTPQLQLSKDRVRTLLTTKKAELEEAIQASPLKSATDRNGFTLGNLDIMTDLAIQELDGTLRATTTLRRVLEIEADEREKQITSEARDLVREGLVIGKDGSIYLQSFSSPAGKEIASKEAEIKKADFLKAKERLQNFALSPR